jgi:hypothetical protein
MLPIALPKRTVKSPLATAQSLQRFRPALFLMRNAGRIREIAATLAAERLIDVSEPRLRRSARRRNAARDTGHLSLVP